ncbi:MAG TPA: hypothetical protein V6C97_16935 [Oculatellaceae cyanobacterium]
MREVNTGNEAGPAARERGDSVEQAIRNHFHISYEAASGKSPSNPFEEDEMVEEKQQKQAFADQPMHQHIVSLIWSNETISANQPSRESSNRGRPNLLRITESQTQRDAISLICSFLACSFPEIRGNESKGSKIKLSW